MASLITVVNELKDYSNDNSSTSSQDNSIILTTTINHRANSHGDEDNILTRMEVEFPCWQSNDPTDGFQGLRNFLPCINTPNNATVKIASINLKGDVIQWYE